MGCKPDYIDTDFIDENMYSSVHMYPNVQALPPKLWALLKHVRNTLMSKQIPSLECLKKQLNTKKNTTREYHRMNGPFGITPDRCAEGGTSQRDPTTS